MVAVVVVTGASRGFGREVAKAFFSEDAPHQSLEVNMLILIGRSLAGLEETRRQVAAASKVVSVSLHEVDLSALDTLDESIDQVFRTVEDSGLEYDEIIFVNNAGSLGHVGPCIESPSLHDMRKSLDLNVASSLWLTVRFARFAREKEVRARIVNVSSLVALQPFPSLGIYSAGKAARDSYHTAMAKESVVGCNIKYLSYAPGPLETDMTNEIRAAPSLDEQLRPHFEKKLIEPQASARVFIKLLRGNTFESGAHIDYYDVAS